jgi:hypothetical protein
MTACCQPIRRTAGWYHSKFCPEHRNEPFGTRSAIPKNPSGLGRAEVASHATRSAFDPEYMREHADDDDDQRRPW